MKNQNQENENVHTESDNLGLFEDKTGTQQNEKENESQPSETQASHNSVITAFLSGSELDSNSNVIVDDISYKVDKSRKVTIDYNPRRNKLIIKQGYEFLNGEKKLKEFIQSLGYKNQKQFIEQEFKKAVYIFGMATIERWYNDLTVHTFSFR